MKFHRTLLALKRQKVAYLLLILVFKMQKNKALKAPKKKHFKHPFFGIYMPKLVFKFYEMDPSIQMAIDH